MAEKGYHSFAHISYDNLSKESVELARRVNSVLSDIFDIGVESDIIVDPDIPIANKIKMAFVADAPEAVDYVMCYIDAYDTSYEKVKVYCEITCGGSDISTASPTLCVGDRLYVASFNGTWYCLNLFEGA